MFITLILISAFALLELFVIYKLDTHWSNKYKDLLNNYQLVINNSKNILKTNSYLVDKVKEFSNTLIEINNQLEALEKKPAKKSDFTVN